MIRYGDGDRPAGNRLLHDDVAASSAHFDKAVLCKYFASLPPESTRSLGNRDLNPGYVNIIAESKLDFFG